MRENREIVLSEQEIQNICNDFGKKLSKELENEEKTPLFLGVMKGALNFMFDLIKRIDRPIFTDFIQISSYAGVQSTGRINLKKDFDMDIKDRTVVVVEDVVDTGLTIHQLKQYLLEQGASSVRVAAMLCKPDKLQYADAEPDYVALCITNEFVIGYGLDLDGFHRNLDAIYKLKD